MPEFNNEDLILIKRSIGNYHYDLLMKKEKLKQTIKKNPDGSIIRTKRYYFHKI